MEPLEEIAKRFVDLKIKHAKCMQKHFRQVCGRCKEYARCQLYSDYFDSWTKLERYFGEW